MLRVWQATLDEVRDLVAFVPVVLVKVEETHSVAAAAALESQPELGLLPGEKAHEDVIGSTLQSVDVGGRIREESHEGWGGRGGGGGGGCRRC